MTSASLLGPLGFVLPAISSAAWESFPCLLQEGFNLSAGAGKKPAGRPAGLQGLSPPPTPACLLAFVGVLIWVVLQGQLAIGLLQLLLGGGGLHPEHVVVGGLLHHLGGGGCSSCGGQGEKNRGGDGGVSTKAAAAQAKPGLSPARRASSRRQAGRQLLSSPTPPPGASSGRHAAPPSIKDAGWGGRAQGGEQAPCANPSSRGKRRWRRPSLGCAASFSLTVRTRLAGRPTFLESSEPVSQRWQQHPGTFLRLSEGPSSCTHPAQPFAGFLAEVTRGPSEPIAEEAAGILRIPACREVAHLWAPAVPAGSRRVPPPPALKLYGRLPRGEAA